MEKIKDKTLAQHLINFCKEKGIQSDPLPQNYIDAGWFLVPMKFVPMVREESLKYQNEKSISNKD